MKKLALIGVLIIGLLVTDAHAQKKVKNAVNKTAGKINETTATVAGAGATVTTTVATAKALKDTYGMFFGNKNGNTIILIGGIESDDTNLDLLKESIKKVKKVKSAIVDYKPGSVSIEVAYKGKAAELWEAIPASSKQLFRIIETGENSIILQYKNAEETKPDTTQNQ